MFRGFRRQNSGPGVRATRGKDGRWYFFDAATGRRVKNRIGITRLEFDTEQNKFVDSRGKGVGAGAFRTLPILERRELENAIVNWRKLRGNPYTYRPAPNEQITERLVIQGRDGKIKVVEISHGRGKKFSVDAGSPQARKFGSAIREAAGVGTERKVNSGDLDKIILHREYLVTTTTRK